MKSFSCILLLLVSLISNAQDSQNNWIKKVLDDRFNCFENIEGAETSEGTVSTFYKVALDLPKIVRSAKIQDGSTTCQASFELYFGESKEVLMQRIGVVKTIITDALNEAGIKYTIETKESSNVDHDDRYSPIRYAFYYAGNNYRHAFAYDVLLSVSMTTNGPTGEFGQIAFLVQQHKR